MCLEFLAMISYYVNMTDEDINKFRKVIKKELKPIDEKLGKWEQKMDALWDQAVRLTEGFEEIKESLDSQASTFAHTNGNLEKVDKRLTVTEGRLGIVPPPELTITG